jgi:hypothetical protein
LKSPELPHSLPDFLASAAAALKKQVFGAIEQCLAVSQLKVNQNILKRISADAVENRQGMLIQIKAD